MSRFLFPPGADLWCYHSVRMLPVESDYHVTCGILAVRGIFSKKLVVINVGNEVSVAVTAKRTPVGRAERCVCRGRVGMTQHRQAGGVCEIPGQQHRGQAPKGRAFWGGNAITMKTPRILASQGEVSWVLKATFGKCPTGNRKSYST